MFSNNHIIHTNTLFPQEEVNFLVTETSELVQNLIKQRCSRLPPSRLAWTDTGPGEIPPSVQAAVPGSKSLYFACMTDV